MDSKTAAVILCAGMGSRLGLPEGQNKCAVSIAGITPIQYTASALLDAGVDSITVVVGYAPESVKKALSGYSKADRIRFVENIYYDRYGCNYSLACAMADGHTEKADRVIIAEGDSLLSRNSVKQIVCREEEAASLVRDKSYVDPARSVIAAGRAGKISRYEYDTSHRGMMPKLAEGECVIGESMQLWLFAGKALGKLRALLREYREEAEQCGKRMLHSGVYSINMLGKKIEPVFSDEPEKWINLNTEDDLRKAGNTSWIIK